MTPPPTPWLVAYRLFGVRLPEQYRPWVAHEVTRKSFVPWWVVRTLLWAGGLIGVYALFQHAMHRWPARLTLMRLALFGVAWAILPTGKTLVRRALRWQRIDKHGHPTRPRRLALLAETEAVLLGIAVVTIVAAAGTAVGYTQRPKGFASASCKTPDATMLQRVESGLTRAGSKITVARSITYGGDTVVGAILEAPRVVKPGEKKSPKLPKTEKSFQILLLQPDGTVYSLLPGVGPQDWTNFPAPAHVDRAMSGAFAPISNCVSAAVRR